MRPTIKQIAERCKLSVSTVSHVLGKRGEAYSPATREKIWKAAEALGYRPNGVARAMREGRFGSIALLLSTQHGRSHLPSALLDALADAAAQADLSLSVATLPGAEDADAPTPKFLLEYTADALLVDARHPIPAPLHALLEEYKLPTVWIGAKREFDGVHTDEADAAYRAARHLLARGHRQIAFVDYAPSAEGAQAAARERLDGYTRALNEASLPPRRMPEHGHLPADACAAHAATWLRAEDRPSAVLCGSRATTLVVVAAARALGLALPAQLKVLEFAERDTAQESLAVATLAPPWKALGQAALAMARAKIESPGRAQPAQVIPYRMPGETLAPADVTEPKTKAVGG